MQRTNVIYLTTKCNLDCDYCYESVVTKKEGFVHVDITTSQIDEFVSEMEINEPDVDSTVVIMGGEPTLMTDAFEYLIEQLVLSVKRNNRIFHCTYITNAVKFQEPRYYNNFLDLRKYAGDNGVYVKLEISYDGVGHVLRTFPDGSSSKGIVEGVLEKLTVDGVEFNISYTVTEENWDKLVEETILIFEKYPMVQKLIFCYDYLRLDDYLKSQNLGYDISGGRGGVLKEEYKPYMNEIYKVYGKPICQMVCDECGKCDLDLYVGLRNMIPEKGILLDSPSREIDLDGVFNRF